MEKAREEEIDLRGGGGGVFPRSKRVCFRECPKCLKCWRKLARTSTLSFQISILVVIFTTLSNNVF